MALEISRGIFSVGVNDPDMRVFDVVVPTAFGSSYNAYLIRGEKATALVETVHEKKCGEFLANLRAVCDISKIDYIVMNHTEPDHSGSLVELLKLAPRAKVVASASALKFLKKITNLEFESIAANASLRLDLGGKTLEFIIAPNLHWPDSMFTYVPEDGILFTCDFLGAHYYEENHPLFSKVAAMDDYGVALKVYFDCIFSPFKKFVQNGLQKIAALDLRIVCPSHGPILDDGIQKAIDTYAQWSTPEEVSRYAVVAYASAYGYTRILAETAEATLKENGYTAKIFDLGVTPPEIVAGEANRADLLFVGTPTFNKDALLPVWNFIAHLSAIANAGKKVGVFGSYGWSGEGVPLVVEHLKLMKYRVQGEGFRAVFKPSDSEIFAMKEYVKSCL